MGGGSQHCTGELGRGRGGTGCQGEEGSDGENSDGGKGGGKQDEGEGSGGGAVGGEVVFRLPKFVNTIIVVQAALELQVALFQLE